MAIKSRGRARGGRAVAAAPRRPLVVRKPPIWRRPWVWIVVGLLAAGGIAFGTLSILHSHDVAGRKDREKLAMTNLFNQFKAGMPADRRAVPPDALVIFPTVSDDLPKIGKDIKGDAAKKRGKEITDAAQKTVAALQAIHDRVNRILPAEFADDRAAVTDGLFLVTRAIDLYRQVGGIVQAAADLPKADQKALIDQATALTQQGGALFDEGYRKILKILNRLGIAPNIAPSVPVAPGGLTSPTPTLPSTPSAEPSESPSNPTASATPSS
jgi:hypothetical protein